MVVMALSHKTVCKEEEGERLVSHMAVHLLQAELVVLAAMMQENVQAPRVVMVV